MYHGKSIRLFLSSATGYIYIGPLNYSTLPSISCRYIYNFNQTFLKTPCIMGNLSGCFFPVLQGIYIYIYSPFATRSIFKQSETAFNSEFSFSLTGCLTKTKESSISSCVITFTFEQIPLGKAWIPFCSSHRLNSTTTVFYKDGFGIK